MIKLDKTDWKILKILNKNSRTPISIISKEARISKAGCFYRLQNLVSTGVIKKYKTRINQSKLGLSTYAVYLKLFDISEEDEKKLTEELSSIKEIKWMVSCTGTWDLMLSLDAKNNLGFHKTLGQILKFGKKHILEYETAIIISTRRLWLSSVENLPEEMAESVNETVEIDAKDKEILSMLSNNSRIEATVISRKLNMTAEAVSYRIKNLVKKKIIHSFDLEVDREQLGLDWYQIQFLLNDPSEADTLLPKIMATGDVGYIVKTLGKWNFEVHLYCKDIKEFRSKLLKLRSIMSGSIRDYETNIILKKYS